GGESSLLVQPQRHGEVVEGHDGGDPVLVAGVEHPPVVGELGAREFALRRLDARPLDPEAEAVEPQAGEHRDVLAIAVIEVARVAGRLPAGGRLDVLPPPPVGVGVVALGLVGRDRGAEQEAFREREDLAHPGQCSGAANPEVDKVSGPNYYPDVKPRRTFVLACRQPGRWPFGGAAPAHFGRSTYGRGLSKAELTGESTGSRHVTSGRRLFDRRRRYLRRRGVDDRRHGLDGLGW